MTDVRVDVAGYPDSDDEERADLAGRLRADFEAVDVAVAHPEAEAPAGSKGAGLEWAQLVAALQGWLGRHRGATVSLEIDGDKLTLADASEADQRRLVETFLARHGAG
jgi:hypothetical protein